jgi:nucleoside-diphosphate-sugar epimerase
MRGAVSEASCVINCVAGNDRTMVRATEVLCEAARLAPPRRIVHLSSMAVYGAATGTVREDRAPVLPLSGYAQAKLACEQVLRRYVAGGGDAVMLRPSCVFGPGSGQWTTRIGRLLQARRIGDLGVAGDGGCNLVFINDLVATIISALDATDSAGRAFNVSSPFVPTWNEFLIGFGMALGAIPIRRIPPRTLKLETKLLAPLRRIASKVVRHPATEAITPSLAALWAQDIRIDSSAAAAVLGMPATPIEEMIEAAVGWLNNDTASLPSEETARL